MAAPAQSSRASAQRPACTHCASAEYMLHRRILTWRLPRCLTNTTTRKSVCRNSSNKRNREVVVRVDKRVGRRNRTSEGGKKQKNAVFSFSILAAINPIGEVGIARRQLM